MQLFEEILKAEEEKYLIVDAINIPMTVSNVIHESPVACPVISRCSDNVYTEEGFCTFCPEPQPEQPLDFG